MLVLLLLLLGLPGRLSADYNPTLVVDPGRVEGFVRFPGETPPRAMFANEGDHDCPHGIAQNHLIVRQENLGLKNAVVILETSVGEKPPLIRGSLTTEKCTLTPRIQALPKGASLQLTNNDGAQHGIEALVGVASEFKVSLQEKGESVRRSLVHPGFYRINCNRHLWERAWIYVSESPYVAVTDDAGHYAIEKVPAGRYIVRVWHEGWREGDKAPTGRPDYTLMGQELEVKVRRKRTTQATFDRLEVMAGL